MEHWRCMLVNRIKCRARVDTFQLDGARYVRPIFIEHTHNVEEYWKRKVQAYKCEPKVERKSEVSQPHEDPEMEVPKEIELQYQYPMELRFPRKCRSIIPMVEFPSDIEEDRSLSPLTQPTITGQHGSDTPSADT